MVADHTNTGKRCGKHLDHHRNGNKRLAEELALAVICVADRMKSCALDNKEHKRCSDLDITLIARTEFLKKDQESYRTQYRTRYISGTETSYAPYCKESDKYEQEAHKE